MSEVLTTCINCNAKTLRSKSLTAAMIHDECASCGHKQDRVFRFLLKDDPFTLQPQVQILPCRC
jgi:hypothetical protein